MHLNPLWSRTVYMKLDDNHRGWAERSGEFSPTYYAQIGANEVSETLSTIFDYYASEDAAILEVGCSSGRHLAHLRDNDSRISLVSISTTNRSA